MAHWLLLSRLNIMAAELLGPVESAVLRAIGDGHGRPHRIAERLGRDGGCADGLLPLYRLLERGQREGLLRSQRDSRGRVFALTAAGRRKVRERRDFGGSVARLLAAAP